MRFLVGWESREAAHPDRRAFQRKLVCAASRRCLRLSGCASLTQPTKLQNRAPMWKFECRKSLQLGFKNSVRNILFIEIPFRNIKLRVFIADWHGMCFRGHASLLFKTIVSSEHGFYAEH
jgi:hypothetical protein